MIHLGGSNFELLTRVGYISQVPELRMIFLRNYDRACLLVHGVYIISIAVVNMGTNSRTSSMVDAIDSTTCTDRDSV